MQTALILIDIQNDYFEGGRMSLKNMDRAAANARKLLDRFRENGWPVVFIQHVSTRPGATFFMPGTEGCEIHPIVAPLPEEPIFHKNFPNSFHDTLLHEFLQSNALSNLVICGAMSHMCIDTTTRAAFELGYTCIVPEDACATRDLVFNGHTVAAEDVHAAYMAALGSVFAKVAGTNQVLNELDGIETD